MGTLMDLDCDPTPLCENNVSIICSSVIVSEEYEKALASIVENKADWTCVPTDFAYTGSIDLDSNTMYQYGKKLYIDGDFYISHDNVDVLDLLDSLVVTGQAYLPEAAVDMFREKCRKTGSLLTYKGESWRILKNSETLTRELLDDMPDGVTIYLRDSELTIADDITRDDILGRIYTIHGSDSTLTIQEQHKIPLRKKIKGDIIINIPCEQHEAEDKEEENPAEEVQERGTHINTAYYKL
jgi:hypothetical protein